MPNFKALHGKMPVRAAGTPVRGAHMSVNIFSSGSIYIHESMTVFA
jgi:hypothetical protein